MRTHFMLVVRITITSYFYLHYAFFFSHIKFFALITLAFHLSSIYCYPLICAPFMLFLSFYHFDLHSSTSLLNCCIMHIFCFALSASSFDHFTSSLCSSSFNIHYFSSPLLLFSILSVSCFALFNASFFVSATVNFNLMPFSISSSVFSLCISFSFSFDSSNLLMSNRF